jgi:DNA-binding IclR family transcriptional regulator
MASRPEFPAQALPVLAALYEQPTQWQDGSALAMQTGLPPERLHPILSRLAVCGLAQIARPGKTQPGRPAGERYRLTADGLASAAIALAAAAQPAGWLAARRL